MHSKWLFRVHRENDCDKYSRQMSHTMLHPINVKTGKNWLQFIVDSFESISKSFHFVFIFRWIRRQNHTLTMHWHSHQATKSFQSKCSYCSSSAKWRHLVWGYNWSRGWYDKSPSTRFATNAKELAKEQTQKKNFSLLFKFVIILFDSICRKSFPLSVSSHSSRVSICTQSIVFHRYCFTFSIGLPWVGGRAREDVSISEIDWFGLQMIAHDSLSQWNFNGKIDLRHGVATRISGSFSIVWFFGPIYTF